jgi:transcriptional regulator with XRE-family HTH domain
MPRGPIRPHIEAEVRRLITRFSIERVAAGWSVWDLSRETGVHPANIHRTEGGETIPTLPVLVALAEPLGLRLDWVPPHLRPLLELDEVEVKALHAAAAVGWNRLEREPFAGTGRTALRALRKLGQLREEGADASED